MIPLSDHNPTRRTPVVTIALLAAIACVWIVVQGAGLDPYGLAESVCNLGLFPGELTKLAALGTGAEIGSSMLCLVDDDPINVVTPFTSMFLHNGWLHLLGNGLFLWIFGNNVEDAMGRVRFCIFYVACGLLAAAAQVAVDPAMAVPMVGASGAISGVMGAYLVLYPRARVRVLFILVIIPRIYPLPAWVVLLLWFGLQVVAAMPQLSGAISGASTGVAVIAHVAGFVSGALLVRPFARRAMAAARGVASW